MPEIRNLQALQLSQLCTPFFLLGRLARSLSPPPLLIYHSPSHHLQNPPPQHMRERERDMKRGQMSQRFKLRIARVLPSFHTCRSQDDVPIPSITAGPSSSSPSSLIKRHFSSALVSVGCRFRSSSSSSSSSAKSNRPTAAAAAPAPDPSPASDFQWQKDEKWHVVAKVPAHHRRRKISSHRSNSSSSDDEESFSKRSADGGKTRARKKPKKKKKILRRKKSSFVRRSSLRLSSSSFDNHCWFSSSERDCGFIHDEFLETRTLVSSDSRSSSSSSDGGEEEANPETSKRRRRKELRLRCPSPEIESPARVSVFRRMVGCGGGGEGKVKESFAVVKRSEDPYGDFRRSMLEMIVEKEMYEKEDLEQLLLCFLSLNSRAHHAVIVQAFSEIWEVLFSGGRQA